MSFYEQNKKNWYCNVAGCSTYSEYVSNNKIIEYPTEPYGSCQNCYKLNVCSKQDEKHQSVLLYNEGCREHHSGGYSVCVYCALEAFQKKEFKNYESCEEHCYCPVCSHDFGLLQDIPNTENYVKNLKKLTEDYYCSIDGCIAIQSNRYDLECNPEENYNGDVIYGSCQNCEDFSICYRGKEDEPEHDKALLYNEGCREHHSGGYSVCLKCATEAHKNKLEKNGEVIEEGNKRCICPECNYDFGLLSDLQYKN